MSFSFIHAADIHLGRPFSGLPEFTDENLMNIYKTGVEKVLNNIVDIAISESVDFVLIAGDTFDSCEQDFSSKLVLKNALKKLEDNKISVYLICANHDPLSSYNKNTFGFDAESRIKIIGLNTQPYEKLPVFSKSGEQVCIVHALSYETEKFTQNPAKYFSKPDENDSKYFNIGLLHSETNASSESPYAPCSLSELKNLGYDYFALGHIHQNLKLCDNIYYSGTVQGRNPKETGIHGIRYIKCDSKQIIDEKFIPTDILRYENSEIDITRANDITAVYDIIREKINDINKPCSANCPVYVLRIKLTGFTSFYEEINEEFFDSVSQRIPDDFAKRVYIEKITNETEIRIDKSQLCDDRGIVGEIMKTLSDENLRDMLYEETLKTLKNVTDKCEFSQDDLLALKEIISEEAKESCISFCSSVYSASERKNG